MSTLKLIPYAPSKQISKIDFTLLSEQEKLCDISTEIQYMKS